MGLPIWINETNGIPIERDFATTSALGPCLCIDKSTGLAYYFDTAVRPLQIGNAVTPEWFGAKGDGTTNDGPALQLWLDNGGALFLPAKLYRSSQKLIGRKHMHLTGVAHGFDSRLVAGGYKVMPGSRIIFDAGISGLELQTSTTLTDPAAVAAAGAGAWTQEGAFNSIIENIGLIGSGGATAFGFMARTFFHASNIQVYSFSGKGFDLNATTDVDGIADYGNLSNSSMKDCGSWQCGSHGLHIRGRDANTCDIQNFNAIQCGGWGIVNESLIPNTFLKPSLSTNTLGAIQASGSQSNLIIFPYIETGAGSNCDLSNNNIVIGDIFALDTGLTPTQIAEISRFNQLHLQNNYAPAALAAEDAFIYKWDGLYLQGHGSSHDITLVNKDGNTVATVPTGTTNLNVIGDYYRNGTKVVGARITGWAAATNTKSKATFDTTTVTLSQLAARVGQLIDDLMTHGLINT